MPVRGPRHNERSGSLEHFERRDDSGKFSSGKSVIAVGKAHETQERVRTDRRLVKERVESSSVPLLRAYDDRKSRDAADPSRVRSVARCNDAQRADAGRQCPAVARLGKDRRALRLRRLQFG